MSKLYVCLGALLVLTFILTAPHPGTLEEAHLVISGLQSLAVWIVVSAVAAWFIHRDIQAMDDKHAAWLREQTEESRKASREHAAFLQGCIDWWAWMYHTQGGRHNIDIWGAEPKRPALKP